MAPLLDLRKEPGLNEGAPGNHDPRHAGRLLVGIVVLVVEYVSVAEHRQ